MAREHGTRAKYVAEKCRCDDCRRANREYASGRNARAIAIAAGFEAEKWVEQKWVTPDGDVAVRFYKKKCPGLTKKGCPTKSHLRKDSKGGLCGGCREHAISTFAHHHSDECREKLFALSKEGFGTEAVMRATGLAKTTIQEIRRGQKKYVLPETERKILTIKPTLDTKMPSALVPARETWDQIRWLLAQGVTKTELATHLGSKAKHPALQLDKKWVTVRNAKLVRELYEEMQEVVHRKTVCDECGLSHLPGDRQERLKRMLPCSPADAVEAFPCLYSADGLRQRSRQARMLARDFHALAAEWNGAAGVWEIPATRRPGRGEAASLPSGPDRTMPASFRTFVPPRSTPPSPAPPPP